MIIFKQKTPPKYKFYCDVIIRQHPKGCMDKEGIIKWINKVWVHRNRDLVKKHFILVLTDKIKLSLKESNTILTVIPGGLTKMLQPLDVSLNTQR